MAQLLELITSAEPAWGELIMKRRLHYEKASYSFVFASDCCVPELLRRRAHEADHYDNDP